MSGADPWALTLTIVLSSIAIVLSILALVWNVVAFLRSGRRVKVELGFSYVGTDGRTYNLREERSWPKSLAELKTQVAGYDEPTILVRVLSTGRLPVTVTRVALGFSLGSRSRQGVGDGTMPQTIEVGGAPWTWSVTLKDAREWVAGDPKDWIRGVVELADGRTARSRKRLLPEA